MTPKGTNHIGFVELEEGPYRDYRKESGAPLRGG